MSALLLMRILCRNNKVGDTDNGHNQIYCESNKSGPLWRKHRQLSIFCNCFVDASIEKRPSNQILITFYRYHLISRIKLTAPFINIIFSNALIRYARSCEYVKAECRSVEFFSLLF